MAGITQAQAQAQLDAWLAASTAAANNQSYKIADRQLTRADAGEIRRNIEYWTQQVSLLSSRALGRGRSRTVVLGG